MKKFVALFLLWLLPGALRAQPSQGAQPKSAVFTHVTVIDATGAPARPDMTVVITGARIVGLGPTKKLRVPENAQVVDATGKYLIPGLWDMHVHIFNYGNDPSGQPPKEYFFPLFIANGVTSVRLMWVRLPQVKQVQLWRKQSVEQPGSVPRIAAMGTVVNRPPPTTAAGPSQAVGFYWRYADVVTTADEARQLVDQIKAGGVDFVKVYSLLLREAYFAIADEARKQQIPFAGHVPLTVSAFEASEAGQSSIEHLTEIDLACSSQEQELRKIAAQDWGPKQIKQMLETYDEAKCARLFARFKENGTWQVPTIALHQASVSQILGESLWDSDQRLKYITPAQREQWSRLRPPPEGLSAEQKERQLKRWQMRLNLVGGMYHAGVGIMAGTDVPNPYVYPGFSLHDELITLVKAGLTPMATLQAATLNPARFLGMEKDLGTVQKGKIADLVLLEANPLEDISNTRKINAVVVSGRLLDRKALDGLLAQAEAAANKK